MHRGIPFLVALVTSICLFAAAAGAVTIASPWAKDDTVGEAERPNGDVRRVVVENGRQNVRFTFRMQAKPIWDTAATSRATFMEFRLDWKGTTAAYNRRITVSFSEGDWRTVVFNGTGGALCVRQSGGVQSLGNFRYRFSVPVGQCLGGPKVIRVMARFQDDLDDSALDDIHLDRVPNSGGYGPFIRLPN